MATVLGDWTNERIHQTAIARLGVADVSIVRAVDGPYSPDGDVWLALSVKRTADDAWLLIGRRRTKAELLDLVSTIDPRHLDGRRL